jgi:Fe2+ or Zn2+ uptake regulation protein
MSTVETVGQSKPRSYRKISSEMVDQVAKDISEQFFKSPGAADTAEGITDWWVARQKRANSLPLIKKALNLLVEEGRVKKRSYGNRTVYLIRE